MRMTWRARVAARAAGAGRGRGRPVSGRGGLLESEHLARTPHLPRLLFLGLASAHATLAGPHILPRPLLAGLSQCCLRLQS
jgi:hypothetical protein